MNKIVLLLLLLFMEERYITYIIQGHFTNHGAIVKLPKSQLSMLEECE